MTFADLFAGIGGFRLGLERAGMTCAWSCEIDPFCRKVYAKNFGKEPEYGDIKEITDPPYVDLVCGGFPCQPFSVAGKQRGAADDRNLWPEMLRIVKLVRPVWVLGENVPGIGDYTDTVCANLEKESYEVLPLDIPACVFGADHERYRRWFIAHTNPPRLPMGSNHGKNYKNEIGIKARPGFAERIEITRLEPCCKSDWRGKIHGIPDRVDRIKSLGNAVVPQVVEWIGRRIISLDTPAGGA